MLCVSFVFEAWHTLSPSVVRCIGKWYMVLIRHGTGTYMRTVSMYIYSLLLPIRCGGIGGGIGVRHVRGGTGIGVGTGGILHGIMDGMLPIGMVAIGDIGIIITHGEDTQEDTSTIVRDVI